MNRSTFSEKEAGRNGQRDRKCWSSQPAIGRQLFDGDETQAQLQEAVSKLPEVQRTVFTMKYFEDMKYSEISKILNTSEGALKASYHLAVKKSRNILRIKIKLFRPVTSDIIK